MKKKFNVSGMMCASCQANVNKCVSSLNGVKSVNVSLLANNMVVEYDENIIDDNSIINAVINNGYGASVFVNETVKQIQEKRKKELHTRFIKLLISFVLLLLLMFDSMVLMMFCSFPKMDQEGYGIITLIEVFIQIVLLGFIIYINFNYFISGYKSLFKLHPNMNSLVALGSTISTVYGLYEFAWIIYGVILGGDISQPGHEIVMNYSMNLYFESAAMILVFVSIGKYFEKKATNKTTQAITSMMALTPDTAYVIKDDKTIEVPVETLEVDNIVLVKDGESIPTDGEIISGYGNIDESSISGESLPVFKKVGDTVIGTTINKNGTFTFKVTKVGKDTTMAKIIDLVSQASESKAKMARLADKISLIFVPTVIAIALITFIVWMFIYNFTDYNLPTFYNTPVSASLNYAITVLVISCPCALGLATPVAIMVGTGKAAEHGILIKNADAFESFKNIDCILFDKTGTLTKGQMKLLNIKCYGADENSIVQKAASLENLSTHPLAQAILDYAKEKNISLEKVEDFASLPGLGIKSKDLFIGNKKLMEDNNIDYSFCLNDFDTFSKAGLTVLFLSDKNKVLALFAIGDTIKDNAKSTIKQLKKLNKEVYMVTGDNEKTANYIANELSIDKVYSQVLPSEKEEIVSELQKKGLKVAFVGDGINDAVALSKCDVALAINSGSDIAIDCADIILVRDDLKDVLYALKLSQKVVKNIKENLLWAFLYNIILIPLAAGVLSPVNITMNPMYGSIAMSISSVSVCLNALRLKLFKLPEDNK